MSGAGSSLIYSNSYVHGVAPRLAVAVGLPRVASALLVAQTGSTKLRESVDQTKRGPVSRRVETVIVLLRYALYVLGMAAFTGVFAWIEIATARCVEAARHGVGRRSLWDQRTFADRESSARVARHLRVVCTRGWPATAPRSAPIAFVFGGLALACAVRELHYFLDQNVADNSWQALVGVILALIIVYGFRQRRRFRVAWLRLWPSPGLTLLFAGCVILFVIVQIIGHEPLWAAILGEDYQRVVKLAAEEFIELVGYFFLLIGTLEYVYQARAIATREAAPCGHAPPRGAKTEKQKGVSKLERC